MCKSAYRQQTVPDMGSSHITGMAEPKVINFCNWMTYHPQKGRGYGHMTVLKFCHLP